MVSKRKFYKTMVQYEVLSEEPIEQVDLDRLKYEITEGRWSGRLYTLQSTELNGLQAAMALENQGSDPEFFNLDINGDDVEDY